MSDKNPFLKIPEDREEPAPEKVKKGVESDMEFIRFAISIVDLYLGKLPSVVTGFMSGFDATENEKDSENTEK